MSLTRNPEVRSAGGWVEYPAPPKDTPVGKGVDGRGHPYHEWEVTFHRGDDGTVTVEHSLGAGADIRGQAKAKAHNRTRVERIRVRLAKRLAERAPEKAGWEEVD